MLEPPEEISTFSYRCDSSFAVEPLLAMLDTDSSAFGFVVVDGHGAVFARVTGNKYQITQRIGDPNLPNKHRRGGQSAGRFFRGRQLARHQYSVKIAEAALQHFIDERTTLPNVDGIVLAGSADIKSLVSAQLDARLKRVVKLEVDVAYGGEQGLSSAISQSGPVLGDLGLKEQAQACASFFQHLDLEDGLGVYGPAHVLATLQESAVHTLLLWDECDLIFHTLCWTQGNTSSESSGELSDDLDSENEDSQRAKSDLVHILCSPRDNPLELAKQRPDLCMLEGQLSIVTSVPFLDHIADRARDLYNVAAVRFVNNCSAEGSQFCAGFGGIGAICRWVRTGLDQIHEVDDFDEDHDFLNDDEFDNVDVDAFLM